MIVLLRLILIQKMVKNLLRWQYCRCEKLTEADNLANIL